MPVVSYSRFPLADKNMSWSFSAADGNRLIDNGGWALFKKVHTWFDDSDGSTPENKAAYKLPHHKYVGDSVKTVWRGVTAAMSRLMQAGTQIPDGDRRGCYNHLSKHYREFDEEPPEFRRYEKEEFGKLLEQWGYDDFEIEEMLQDYQPYDPQVYARQFGTPTPKQMEMINRLAKVELQPEQVFVFPDKLVGDMVIPYRYIQIHKSLLNVFKQDAKAGVSLLLDHPWAGIFARPKAAIAYGRTFDAQLKRSDAEGEEWALFADHYLVRGKEIDGISTDSIITSIQDGTFFDTSIGWGADTYECSICGNNYLDYSKCEHYAGREYDGELCYVIAKPPGFLMENSLVFDGAYPGAGVMSRDGTLENAGEMVLVNYLKGLTPGITLFHTYSSRKGKLLTFARREDVEKKIITQGVTLSRGGEKLAEERDKLKEELEKESQEEQEIIKKMEQVAEELGFDIYLTRDEVEEVFGEGCEIEPEELLMYAKEGEKYLAELREEAEKWGIRAKGDRYNKKAWETRFELMSADELKDIIETFKAEAEIAIPAGRKSDPEAQKQGENDSVAFSLPDEAYGV